MPSPSGCDNARINSNIGMIYLSQRSLMQMKTTNLVEIKSLTKHFPGVVALDSVDLEIKPGEVHVLVGENGAGKSTLVKILCGIYQPDDGVVLYEDECFSPQSTLDSIQAGIRVIHQEMNLLSYLSVAENIFLEKIPGRFGLVDRKALKENTKALLSEVGLRVSPDTLVEHLGVAQMQLVELARALSEESKLLIMDEPTSTLSPREISTLFEIIRSLKARGVTIIYISHRLQEIFEIGDRVTVLRNGKKVGTKLLEEVTIPEIVKMMVGRDIEDEYPFRPEVEIKNEVLKVENLSFKGSRAPVSFSIKRGEILGIAGLVGSGRTEMVRALFGVDGCVEGGVRIKDKPVEIKSPKQAVANGLCLLTEDRKGQGLILDMSCLSNITITDLSKVSKRGFLVKELEKDASEKLVEKLHIKTPSLEQIVKNLSGGNQQKLVLAKWLYRDTEIFIFDEPTRGIDVGAKYEIYNLIWDLAEAGKGIIMISSDLPELIGVCHRILVMSKKIIVGEVHRKEFDQERILSLAYQEYIQEGNGHAN